MELKCQTAISIKTFIEDFWIIEKKQFYICSRLKIWSSATN